MKGKNAAYPKAIDELKEKEELAQSVELRQSKYLNNIVEQDHPCIKRLVAPWHGIRVVQYGKTSTKRIRAL